MSLLLLHSCINVRHSINFREEGNKYSGEKWVKDQKHTSMLPDLHSLLNYSSIPDHNLFWNLQRNPAHKISFQQFPNSPPASSVVAPNTLSNPRKQNHVSMPVGLFRCASQVAAVIVAAPIERVWILMQYQNEMIKYGHLSSPYKGMKDCFMRTIKHEGFLSLWRGSSVSVIGSLTAFLTREVVFPITPRFWHLPLLMLNFQFLYPLYYARVRLANDVIAARKLHFSLDSTKSSFSNDGVGSRKFSGASDVLCKTFKSEGIFGPYRGYLPACLVTVGSYLCAEWAKSVAMQNKEKKTSKIFFIPAFMVFGIPVVRYPFGTVSRRMRMTTGEKTKYNGAVDAVRQIVKYEGVSSLYKGFTPHLIHFSIISFTYTYAISFARKMQK